MIVYKLKLYLHCNRFVSYACDKLHKGASEVFFVYTCFFFFLSKQRWIENRTRHYNMYMSPNYDEVKCFQAQKRDEFDESKMHIMTYICWSLKSPCRYFLNTVCSHTRAHIIFVIPSCGLVPLYLTTFSVKITVTGHVHWVRFWQRPTRTGTYRTAYFALEWQ